jgi:hypothetical protein
VPGLQGEIYGLLAGTFRKTKHVAQKKHKEKIANAEANKHIMELCAAFEKGRQLKKAGLNE